MEITLSTADQIVGIVFTIVIMQLMRKPFMKDPTTARIVTIAFIISTITQVLICLYIKKKIKDGGNQKKFKYKPEASMMSISEEPAQELEMSYAEYDNNEATKNLRTLLFQTALYSFMAFKFKNTQPMILQTLGLLKNLVLSPLYRAYLYNMEINRPFESNVLFSSCCTATKEEAKSEVVEKKKKKEE